MRSRIESEFSKFHSNINKLPSQGYRVCEEIENGYIIMPSADDGLLLTMMALTHGDETAGIVVLNTVVEFLLAGCPPLPGGLALLLGNYPAALQGQRYVQRDLNRCFDAPHSAQDGEAQRARAIAAVISKTQFFIDFHQTTTRSPHCFGIFPFQRQSLEFAQLVNCGQPAVCRFGGRFSQDGMCSDEFVQEQGNVAITIELGQKGFDPYQIAQGVLVALRALILLKSPPKLGCSKIDIPVYDFQQTIMSPASGDAQLVEGLFNFKKVARNEQLAVIDGKAVLAQDAGVILFPKYSFVKGNPPSELCHVLSLVPAENIPD